jgi:selenocysteine lyase/cysteine desulfurase
VAPEVARTLEPRVTGWFGHATPFRFDPTSLERAADTRRFDMGTPSVASVYAQLAGLSLLEEIGLPEVQRATGLLAEDFIGLAADRGLRPKVHADPLRRSAIVMLPRRDPAADVKRLAEAGFIVDARPGHVRVSPYFYNLPEDHRALLEHLSRE